MSIREEAVRAALREPYYGMDEPDRRAYPERIANLVADLYEKRLKRLASMEGFTIAGVVDKNDKWCRELLARIEYAREGIDFP